MALSFRTYHKKERHKRQWITLSLIAVVVLSAAVYMFGSRMRLDIHMNKGYSLIPQRNFEAALHEFNYVLQLSTNYAPAIDAIGQVYLNQGDLVRAEIKYEQAVKNGLKASRNNNHIKIGNSFLDRGIYAPAELEFRHALDLAPKDPQAHLGHAFALHALGRLPEALEEYRKVLSLDPDITVASQKLTLARQDYERGFTYYMFDRQGTPLARVPLPYTAGPRYYSLAQYGSQLIGYTNAEHGNAGLEKLLEKYLPGNTVTLTLDSQWQRAADSAMGWHKGSLVALNPATGEILALINHPSFNPNRLNQDWNKIIHNKNEPLLNRAFDGLYTPGSIFKLVTAAAALETKIDMKRIFPVMCPGSIRYDAKPFWCWQRHGRVDSLQSALDTSCNLAMAEIGFNLGPDRMYEYSNKFGFGFPLTLAFESSVVEGTQSLATSVAPIVNDNHFDIAERACGLSDAMLITPMQAALLAATIANQGRTMTPYFIKEIRNIRGTVIGQGIPKVARTPIKPETATALKAFMVDAVKHGIGKKAQISGITVAGKTGTTGDSRRGLNGWFVCFAPAENPQVAVAVFAEKEGTGMDRAAPIARQFLESILKK